MMRAVDPTQQKAFAAQVVQQLRARGHEAYWAGGCVRDHLIGRVPQDYDVATDALPDQVREVFGRRRTLAIGAAFGVITVLGRGREGQIEVATFRSDAAYSDGRHPDSVRYSSAEEDAARRDFTINGMFFDPVDAQVIDFVGGREDLDARVVRAIGDPRERIAEDKLRMLRGVRFAANLEFDLDRDTAVAIGESAAELTCVSAERIAGEMRRMLVDAHRVRALQLLDQTALLAQVIPEVAALAAEVQDGASRWTQTLAVLDALSEPSFPEALAVLLHRVDSATDSETGRPSGAAVVLELARRWKLSNDVRDRTQWLLVHWGKLNGAQQMRWSELHPLLIAPGGAELLAVHRASAQAGGQSAEPINHCEALLAQPRDVIDPAPLITGNDLIARGLPPGREFATWLAQARAAQLDGEIRSPEQAMELIDRLRTAGQPPGGAAAP